jgi:two-component system sensor histidine kinase MprB
VTLGRRVVLATSLAVGLIALLLGVSAYVLVKRELYHRLDASLEERALVLAPNVQPQLGTESSLPLVATPGELVQVLRQDGTEYRPPYQATRLPAAARNLALSAGSGRLAETADVNGSRFRVVTTHLRPGYALQVARPLTDEDAALARLRWIFLLLSVAALSLSLLLGGWIAESALRPVRRQTQAAEDVSRTRNLSLRLGDRGRDEVARLGAAFNRMLGALERSLAAQRQLVADASHEFRTPLTSIRANAELLERGAVADAERSDVARAVIEQVDELDGLVTDVIELALDGEAQARFEDVRLDRLVEDEVERMRRHAPAITFALAAQESVVHGDAQRLQRAVSNVLANAAKWSPAGSTVDVRVEDGVVTVRDRGPGIDEADLPLVFERFYRSANARGLPGSGLGLAIVRHVAEAHGGTVEASNAPDGGAVLTLRLP